MTHDCVYATEGWSAHDERWVAALDEVGFAPRVISLGRDVVDPLDFRLAVDQSARGIHPVLAGPLDSVARLLVDLPGRVVGLSWGSDLEQMAARRDDVAWLDRLAGIVVASRSGATAAVAAGIAADRITVVPWGVDLTAFPFHAPWIDAFQLGVPPHAHLVVSLLPHEPGMRIEDIIDAFARVPRRPGLHEDFPDPYLIIGGEGSATAALADRTRSLGIAARTRFLSEVPDRDLVPLLGRAACLVSGAESAGPATELLQAMACGTPVLASDIPTHRDWIEHGVTGSVFPVGDVAALALLIDEVTHRYPIAEVERARRRVELEADWHATIERLRAALVAPVD